MRPRFYIVRCTGYTPATWHVRDRHLRCLIERCGTREAAEERVASLICAASFTETNLTDYEWAEQGDIARGTATPQS